MTLKGPMTTSPILWSARACPFRKAGVYYGLSEPETHLEIAHRLYPRRGRLLLAGTVSLAPSTLLPCIYVAVRDPSAVRVVPVRAARAGGVREEDLEHVSLVFPPHPRPRESAKDALDPTVEETIRHYAAAHVQAGFVVTIGLRVEREEEFHHKVLLHEPGVPYGDLCDRITALKHDFAA